MIFYITVLRALAAMLITNAHYTGVYPIEIIANGGLLGDVIFFAVSGFCLYNIKDKFVYWYKKRVFRIYPAVWIITIIYLILGLYKLDTMNIFQYMIYPTYYHFIASIVILYILYYIILYYIILYIGQHKNYKRLDFIIIIMLIVFTIQIILYVTIYDKSYYHIDTVREWMIRFIFFESMLLGAYFRKNLDKYINKNKIINWIITVLLFILYMASKLVFAKNIFTEYQLMNQIILFILLYYVFKSFSGIDDKLNKLNRKVKKTINFIASITLEIYLVQYPIIALFRNIMFPLNWIIITTAIIISAYLLHVVVNKVILKKISFRQENKINENTIDRSI